MPGTGQPGAAALGALLRRYRERRGLTQENLAERAGGGLSVATISNLERGRTRPYTHTLAALAAALGLADAERDTLLAAGRRKPAPGDPPAADAAAPPAAAPLASLAGLPAPLTPLVGREREAAAVAGLVRGGARLVTLTGPGGVGKTRLALAVAAGLGDAFPDGVVFVDLAPLADPALVLPTVARALGLRDEPGLAPAAQLAAVLGGRRVLLVLDNLEHLLAAAPAVADVLAAAPGPAALATSRAALRVRGEREFPVLPLALPDPARAADPAALAAVPAVALLVQRARAARPDFALTAENAAAVARICARLDGLPLALELVAARLKLLSPAALLARLDRALPLLAGGAHDLPARQRTLRATLAWSDDLLDAAARRLFHRLGVFAGGCTLEAAVAVAAGGAGDAPGPDGDVLDGLTALLDASLLRRVPGPGDEPRFALLETIREYALERLAASGEEAACRDAHAAHILALAETAEPALRGARQRAWLERLEAEHDNLRAALGWALERHATATAVRLAGALHWFWFTRGHFSEGRAWLERALAAGAGAPAPARAKALSGAGMLLWRQGDHGRAAALLEEGAALAGAVGDRAGRAYALHHLAHVREQQGDAAGAAGLFEESLALYRRPEEPWGRALTLTCLGAALHRQGDDGRAVALLEEGLARWRTLGDGQGLADVLLQLGLVTQARGATERAKPLLEESLALCRDLGDKQGIALALVPLARLALGRGDAGRAEALLEESLALRRDLGEVQGIAECLEELAGVARARGNGRPA